MKKRSLFLLVLLILFAAAYVASNRFIKTKGYEGLVDFIPSYFSNSFNSSAALDTLYIKIDDDAYEKFSTIRDEALERGIIVNPDDPWVEGRIKYKGDKVKADLRLKGKMTDHVQGKKWSFRVKTKKGELINHMHRFSLQHPGTRNYLYEWVHQTLAREQGMMALNYQFVHVYLNKEDLGIYALEENFDKELAFNNERSLGPIFRFDPDAYWEYRLLGTQGYSLQPEYTTFQSSFIDPLRSYSVEDSIQRQYLEEALYLMNSFREGKLNASEALNIDLFAKKYAILDVIGGYHSVDWSDVKFYYDPIQKRIEPIAYESFSVRKINSLIGFDKFRPDEAYHDDFHTILFSDSAFYSSYINYLTEFSKEDFMPSFFERNDSILHMNLKVLNSEFPYKRFETKLYAYNASVVRKLLDPKLPLHVFLKRDSAGAFLQVGNVSSLPIVLDALQIGETKQNISSKIIAPKLRYGFVNYKDLAISISDSLLPSKVYFHILGEEQVREVEVFAYEHPETDSLLPGGVDFKNYIGVLYYQKGDSLIFKGGKHYIAESIEFPANMCLIAHASLQLDFQNNASFIIKGNLKFKGRDEAPILLIHPSFVFLNGKETSSFKDVSFKEMEASANVTFSYPAALVLDHSTVELTNCIFENATQTIVFASNSELNINSSTFYKAGKAIKADFSTLNFENVNFSLVESAISLDASQLKGKNLFFNSITNKAINIEKWSGLELANSEFSKCKIALSVKSGSKMNGKGVVFSANELDLELKSKDGYGISKVSLNAVENGDKLSVEKDEESELTVD